MKVFSTKLSNVGKQFSLRLDSKYRGLWDKDQNLTVCGKLKIADVLCKMDAPKKEKGNLDEEMYILDISETQARYGKLEDSIQKTQKIGSDKTVLDSAEFIVSKLCMSKGYIFTNPNKVTNLIGSTELIPYNKRDNKINLEFLRNVLLNDEYLKTYDKLETGKTPSQKRVNPIDFMQLTLPDVPYKKQEELGNLILKTEEKVKKLKELINSRREKLDLMIRKNF